MHKFAHSKALHVKPPLPHKTQKNTVKNWITIARACKLSLFKRRLLRCGISGILF